MARTRYTFREPDAPHFITCTVVNWQPLFTRPEHVQIILESLRWLQENAALQLFGYVIMENHLHLIAGADNMTRVIARFKSFTARRIIDRLIATNAESLLHQLSFSKLPHKHDREYQLWQEGSHPQAIQSDEMMRPKLEYMHYNPVRRVYIAEPAHWRYSSAGDYQGIAGLLPVSVSW